MRDIAAAHRRTRLRLRQRKMHVRKQSHGTAERTRLSIYRSNRHIYAQVIDDINRKSIIGCSTLSPKIREKIEAAKTKIEEAKVIGEFIAVLAREKGIEKVMFDRNGRKFHGRVKALADGARAGGLEF